MNGSGRLAEASATVAGRAGLPGAGAAVVGGRLVVAGVVLEVGPPGVVVEPAPEPADEQAARTRADTPTAAARDRRSRRRVGGATTDDVQLPVVGGMRRQKWSRRCEDSQNRGPGGGREVPCQKRKGNLVEALGCVDSLQQAAHGAVKGRLTDMATSGHARRSGSGNRRRPANVKGSATGSRPAPLAVKPHPGSAREAGHPRKPVRRDERRRRQISSQKAGVMGGAIVVAVIVVIILISTLSPTHAANAGAPIPYRTAPAAYVTAVTQVPVAQLDAAGTGGTESSAGGFVPSPKQPLLFSTTGGTRRPILVYVGAEYCPYCAASRWPLIIALSRFGTFTGLGLVASSPYDIYANTSTWSFEHASYSSPYVVFEPTDVTSNVCAVAVSDDSCPDDNYVRLQSLSPANSALFSKYDAPPYSATQQGIPFFDWGGLYISSGSQYVPNLINLGSSDTAVGWHPMTWQEIINNLRTTPLTPAGEGILGTANIFTAAICKMTSGRPGSVCDGSVIEDAAKLLPKS